LKSTDTTAEESDLGNFCQRLFEGFEISLLSTWSSCFLCSIHLQFS